MMLKLRQLFLISPKSHLSSILAPEVMLETSSDLHGLQSPGEDVAQSTQPREPPLSGSLV